MMAEDVFFNGDSLMRQARGDIGGSLGQRKRADANVLHRCKILISYKGRSGDRNNGGLGL